MIVDFFYTLFNSILLKQPSRGVAGGLVGILLVILNSVIGYIILIGRGREVYVSDDIIIPTVPLYRPEWHLLALGVIVVYFPTIYKVAVRSPEFDEDVEAAFRAIERAKMPDAAKARAYQKLCETVITRISRKENEKH